MININELRELSANSHALKEESDRKLRSEAADLCCNLDSIFNDYFKDAAKKGEYKFDGQITLLSGNPNVHTIESFIDKFNTRQQGLRFLGSALSDYLTHKKLHVNAVDITVSTTQYNLSVQTEIIFKISVDWKRQVHIN